MAEAEKQKLVGGLYSMSYGYDTLCAGTGVAAELHEAVLRLRARRAALMADMAASPYFPAIRQAWVGGAAEKDFAPRGSARRRAGCRSALGMVSALTEGPGADAAERYFRQMLKN